MRRWACSALLARGLHSRRVATILALLFVVLALVAAVWPPGPVVSAAPAAGALSAADAETAQAVAVACGPGPHFRVLTLMQLDGRQLASVTAQSGATLLSLDFGTGRPLQNAFIDIGTQVGRSGTFTVPLPAGSTSTSFSVRTATPGAAPVTVPFVVNTSCGSAPTLVGGGSAVPFGGSVKGTVFNACNGQPVPGATVQVKGGVTSVTTDGSGRYELFGPLGTHTVEIMAAGFPTNVGQVTMTRGGNVALPLPIDGPTGTVTGQVLRAQPLPVQPIWPVWVNLAGTSTRVTAIGPDARYTMPNVPRGQQKLTVIESGWVPAEKVVNVCPGTNTADINLIAAVGSVTVTVLDVCGQPGGRIIVSHVGGLERGLANAQGSINFPVIRSGTRTFQAETGQNDGFITTQKAITVPVQQTVQLAMTITGGRGAVRGTVRDGDGNPVNLATVRISESGQQATTNASGFYQIVDVPVGDGSALTLIASKTDVASDAATFNVCPGQTVDVSPRLIQGIGLIRTTVLAECDNVPLNGAVMTVQSTGQTGTADALGQLSIPDVPSGTQTLVTTKSNFTGDTRMVAVPLGTALNVGTIRLPGGRAVITGTVVDANNAPVSSAAVSVNVAFGTTFTNGAGQFTLQVPANTSTTGYTLEVTKQDYSTLTRATQRFCDGTTNIGMLTLQKPVTTGTLTGIVRTCDTGEGVTGATVEISSTSGFQVPSGSGGRFTIPNVPPGLHTLRVLKNGFDSRDYGPFTLAAGQTLDVGTFLLCAHTTTSEIQIELTWGTGANLPRDLDLHMSGPLQQFDPGRYHLWFREPVYKNCVATLGPQDSNNSDGGGPERITIRQSYGLDPFTNVADCESTIWVDGEYRIWVHNYRVNESDPLSFANSGAKVVIRRNNSIIHTIDLAHASGIPTDRLWYVCRFDLKIDGTFRSFTVENRFVPGTKDDQL